MTLPINEWLYLSHVLGPDTPSYGGREGMKIRSASQIKMGNSSNSSEWVFSNHLGTHIDAPAHFCDSGQTIDAYPPEFWRFARPKLVPYPIEPSGLITRERLEKIGIEALDGDLLLFKTGFEAFRDKEAYWKDNPGFEPEAASWLRENLPHLRAVGMDFLSVTRWQNREMGRIAHRNFLETRGSLRPLLLIEDMSLSPLKGSPKEVWILPLRVSMADGAPCTAIARLN